MRSLAPVVLFVYKRPQHTSRVLEALSANRLAAQSDLVVYSDGPKTEAARPGVEAVRECIRGARGFKSVSLTERAQNVGLAGSIIAGVSEMVERHGRVIVLEDDLVTSPYFLDYMNDGLELYVTDERVASIHGYMYPVRGALPETFFLRGADCWGWATWKRGWRLFEPDAGKLAAEIEARGLEEAFDMEGAFRFNRMLRLQAEGKLDSWAIRWHASAFLRDKFTLYPGKSFVRNIGTDGSGTHGDDTSHFDGEIAQSYAGMKRQPVEDCETAKRLIREFNPKAHESPWRRILGMARKRAARLIAFGR